LDLIDLFALLTVDADRSIVHYEFVDCEEDLSDVVCHASGAVLEVPHFFFGPHEPLAPSWVAQLFS
jgi:hypothetical protein